MSDDPGLRGSAAVVIRKITKRETLSSPHHRIVDPIRRAIRQRRQHSISDLYLMLGMAYARELRFEDSVRAFGLAVEEGGTATDVLADLAAAAMKSGRRNDALRAYLELAVHDPERAERPITKSLELLDAAIAEEHGEWILDEWHPAIQTRIKGPAAAAGSVLAGATALLRGRPNAALELFKGAGRVPSKRIGARLPTLAAQAGASPWTVAQACASLGLTTEALDNIDKVLDGRNDELEVPARELRVRVLETANRRNDLAPALFALGRAYDLRRRHADAVNAFERSVALNPRDPVPWWYLADSRRLTVAETHDRAALRRARTEWEQGFDHGTPSADRCWVYLTGALLIEDIGNVGDPSGGPIWLAALQVEQALALVPENGDAWAMSARYHRYLGNEASSVHAADRAVALGTQPRARIEQANAHVITGAPDAEDLLEQCNGRLPGFESHLATLQGVLRLTEDDIDAAHAAFRRATALDDRNLWALQGHMGTSVRRGEASAVVDDAEHAFSLSDPDGPLGGVFTRAIRGIALTVLERYGEAIALLRALADSDLRDAYDACVTLSVAELLLGNLGEAVTWMERADARATHLTQVRLTSWLLDLADAREAETAELRRVQERSSERLKTRTFDVRAARQELAGARERAVDGSAKWLVTTAALARLDAEQNELSDAIARYEELVENRNPVTGFPAAAQALVKALERESRVGTPDQVEKAQQRLFELGEASPATASTALATAQARAGEREAALSSLEEVTGDDASHDIRLARLRLGDLQLSTGDLAGARETYCATLAAARDHGDVVEQMTLSSRLGVLEASDGRLSESARRFREVVTQNADPASVGTAENIVMWAARDILGLDRAPPALTAVLRGLAENPDLTPLCRRRLSGARFATIALDRDRAGRPLKPILIETAPGLLDPEERAALRDLIPLMRDQIRSATGVRHSGVGVRESQLLGRGRYRILIEEIPRAAGRVPDDTRFAPDGDLAGDGVEVRDTFTGARGAWTSSGAGATGGIAGGLLWHLEGVLRLHLARFIGLSEVDYLLDEWESEADGRVEIVDRVLPDKRARIRLSWILRALVRGHVPIDDLESILRSQEDAQGETPGMLVELGRQRAHHALADVVDDRLQLELPEELLGGIERDVPGTHGELRRFLAGHYPGSVFLTVERAEARPSVQRALERVWPSGAVLSQQEAASVHVPGISAVAP